jgi:NodT family efflux transporter outer membrane factor (OMF) lipoprotein
MKRYLILLLAVGCSVGPDYRPPKTATPAQWAEPLAGGTTNTAAQLGQWWKSFNDAELDSLISRAVQTNHDLRIAIARVKEAKALRSGALADFLPTITAAGSYNRQRLSANGQSTTFIPLDTEKFQAGLDATWEIDIFGGQRRTLEAATAEFTALEESQRDVLIALVAEVARTYLEIRGDQRRLEIARRNLHAQREGLAIAEQRFKAGLTSELDVSQARTLFATTEAQLPVVETALARAMHRVEVLLALQPGTLREELAKTAPLPVTPPEVPVGMPSELLRRRPDVRRSERQLASATAQVGMQTAELWPKLIVLGAGGFQSLSGGDLFTVGSRYWSAGPKVTWRLLEFPQLRAKIRAQNAQQEQVLAAYEKTVLTAFEDVENALVAYAKEQERCRLLNTATAANRRAAELANQLYTAGLTEFLTVLDAERSLYQVEDQLVQSEQAVVGNLVLLYKALGGGWETKQ